MSAAEIFNSYRNEVVAHQCGTQFTSVNRMQISLLMQLMRIYKDPRLDLTKPLNVNFVGENAADVGGPTKDYFHEAISILSKVDTLYNIQLFGGQEGHLLPLVWSWCHLFRLQAGTKVRPDQLGPPVRVGSTRIDSDQLGLNKKIKIK